MLKSIFYPLGFLLQLACFISIVLILFTSRTIAIPYGLPYILLILGIIFILLGAYTGGKGYQANCFSILLIVINVFLLFLVTVTVGLQSFGNIG